MDYAFINFILLCSILVLGVVFKMFTYRVLLGARRDHAELIQLLRDKPCFAEPNRLPRIVEGIFNGN